eukprot:gene33813-43695_t
MFGLFASSMSLLGRVHGAANHVKAVEILLLWVELGTTALYIAARNGLLKAIEIFLERGCQVRDDCERIQWLSLQTSDDARRPSTSDYEGIITTAQKAKGNCQVFR